MPRRKRFVSSPASTKARPLLAELPGRYFDLRAIFNKLNAKYFGNSLRRYRIIWGRRRRQRPRLYLTFATIQEEDRVIRVHPLLDAAFVPRWFLEYVLYHEMLHAKVPDEPLPSGRRRVHTARFRELERRFPLYTRARRWEAENLRRFFRR